MSLVRKGDNMPLTLTENISAYEQIQNVLEADKLGKWVVFYDGNLVGDFEESHEAIEFAVENWGRGPFLIRKVGSAPFVMPASVQYRGQYASG